MIITPEHNEKVLFQYVEVMKDIRIFAGFTQTELSQRAGLSEKYVTLLEGRKRVPSIQSLVALLSAVGAEKETAVNLVMEFVNSFKWAS